VVVACAATPEKAPAQAPAMQTSMPSAYGQPPAGAYPPPTAPAQPGYPPQPGGVTPAPEPSAGTPGTRAIQLQGASRDLDAGERQLDVSTSDCGNACRALGSMDRATGVLCQLAQQADEQRRCDDAKKKVYSARDRVKSTCGSCPGGPSVERADPIPSTR
jgi:hypothetical protein